MDLRAAFAAWAEVPAEALAGWEFVPYERDGRPVALAALDGTEIHFAIAPEQRHTVIYRRVTRDFLRPLMARRGYLTTRSQEGDQRAARFLSRLGFIRTSSSPGTDHWMLTALPFEREN